MLKINIDHTILDRMASVVEATDGQIEAARASALRQIGAYIKRAVKSQAAKELKVPQTSLDGRFYTSQINPGDDTATVWIGTWAVSPFEVGVPVQYGIPGKSGGVVVGSALNYPGAFLSQIYTSNTKVWIRKSSKHYSPELYPTKYRSGDRGIGAMGRGRFPVVRAAIRVDDIMKKIIERDGADFQARFLEIFSHELNYQVNVKGMQ